MMTNESSCCAGMAHYSTNEPRTVKAATGIYREALESGHGEDRFTDPECLIHVADDGQLGIILHDGSGRYSIIKFCPWCGSPVGADADERIAQAHAALGFVEEPPFAQGHGLPPAPRSHRKRPGSSPKLRVNKVWTDEERAEQSRRVKAQWAARRAKAAVAPGQDEGSAQ